MTEVKTFTSITICKVCSWFCEHIQLNFCPHISNVGGIFICLSHIFYCTCCWLNVRMLFKTFSSLLCPPPPPPSTLTADDFATFFINKIKTISAQFSTPQSVKHILPANIHSFTSFSSLSEAEVSKLILSNHPTCPLDPIPSHLLQAISPAVVPALTHIINTSLHTGVFPSAFKQARITPLLKKPTLNPSLLENYRLVSLPFIAKTLERAAFNQVSAFLTQNNLLDSKVWFQKWTFNRDCLALSCWSPKTQEQHSSGLSLTSQIGPSRYLGEAKIKVATSNYWGASGLSSWTTSLLCLHCITRFCHSETWLFISLLCWWHSTLPLIPF